MEGTIKIDRYNYAPGVGGKIHAGRSDTGAMIIDHHVEAAEMLNRRGDHRVALGRVPDVTDGHLAGPAEFADFIAHWFEMPGIAAGDQHRRLTQRELAGNRDTNTSAATSNDC